MMRKSHTLRNELECYWRLIVMMLLAAALFGVVFYFICFKFLSFSFLLSFTSMMSTLLALLPEVLYVINFTHEHGF